jgi:hypothetical protein
VDTHIDLGDLGVSSWSDVYLGIFGGSWDGDPIAFSSANSSLTASPAGASSFSSNTMDYYFGQGSFTTDADGNKVGSMSTAKSYWDTFQLDGANPSYGTLLNGNPELQLADDSVLTLAMYGYDAVNDVQSLIGNWTLDTTGSSLVISYAAAVPIPGSLLLLGSGLMGLLGIRRRKA